MVLAIIQRVDAASHRPLDLEAGLIVEVCAADVHLLWQVAGCYGAIACSSIRVVAVGRCQNGSGVDECATTVSQACRRQEQRDGITPGQS